MASVEAPNHAVFALPRRLFVAFEGGGAKALVHVGALKAIEDRGFEIKGVAGTSAGAIVAALKAVGYTADEIVDPVAQRTILDTYNQGSRTRATDILGRNAWSTINRVRFFSNNTNRWGVFFWCAVSLWAVFLNVSLTASFYNGLITAICIYVACTIFIFILLKQFFRKAGLASARSFRNALNNILCKKLLGSDQVERDILMADVDTHKHPCLRIVAADISSRQLRLFSSDSEDDRLVDRPSLYQEACLRLRARGLHPVWMTRG
jgi:NTE family protein